MGPLRRLTSVLNELHLPPKLFCTGVFCVHHQKRTVVSFHRAADHEVYISTCQNIYFNLALEDWIYTHIDFSANKTLLLLWRNQPCVVIGRHQNPWAECNISKCLLRGVDISRRKSGGGTVFHDLGNLNCSFFTSKKKYDRSQNLEILAHALRSRWNLDVSLSDRDDLMLEKDYKISGTAAKLGGKKAYHHCTLLFDVNKDILQGLLRSPMWGLQSKATESVRSDVKNLREAEVSITYSHLLDSVSKQYLQHYDSQAAVQYLDPTREQDFPGIYKLYQDIKHWDWVYGKTPKFSVLRTHDVKANSQSRSVSMTVHIHKGLIDQIELQCKELDVTRYEGDLIKMFRGVRFWPDDISQTVSSYEAKNMISGDKVFGEMFEMLEDMTS